MYGVVQFAASEGGTVAVIVNKWLTPKKTEIYWPPTKETKTFDKLLHRCSSPNEKWSRYPIDRIFYETDQLEKAKKKLKLAEITSDIQTEEEQDNDMTTLSKRIIKRNNKYISSDEEAEDHLPRPPPLKKPLTSFIHSESSTDERENAHGSQTSNSDDTSVSKSDNNNSEPSGLPGLSSTHLNSNYGFQDKVVALLAHIKAQNDIIVTLLQDRENVIRTELRPEFKFPLENLEDLQTVEQLLTVKENFTNVVTYFKSLGGQGLNNKVSRVMKHALSDSMASKFNFYGKRSDKKPFAELRLRASIVESLKSAHITEKHIEDSIKGWLKHAPERVKKRLSKEDK